ncbi:pyridoxamine 5'-phosphate oxidase family protein [Paractinoplanes toevensis]|uniref:Pyridoxamine 5'-phosphate oxidase N-terminal domain-containing protein n=1 Tax=Paractinoplanes toevensis TaxID=571911 RepID=A0A919W424_9ACTN|nr:pyridoxamine 5'-phosphate oxidase family protein [Actinoplanes toevensis]GIM91130.1 hypothetical protein Ato02nite_029230 [Actinoplanes toevensis]
MKPAPRSRAQRRHDTEHLLNSEVDLWVATSSPAGEPWLVPLSFEWDGTTLLLATSMNSRTGRNLADGAFRLGLGPTRDVAMIDGEVEVLELDALPRERGDRFAERTGFDPRGLPGFNWFRVTPRRVQAWRDDSELSGRDLMRAGIWLT